MSAPERRLLWALAIGAVVFALTAGDTNAWFFNLLVGAAYGVPVTLVVWCLLEGMSWVVESRQSTPPPPPTKSSNVRVMRRYGVNDDRRPE